MLTCPPTDPTVFLSIPEDEWTIYERVFNSLEAGRIQFAIGGGFAKQCYSGVTRRTKDLDVYILPSDRDAAIAAVSRAGMTDYFEVEAYDRRWIYRSCKQDVIVDIIWAMANQRSQVDDVWLTFGPQIAVRGRRLRLVPAEELIWAAIYVLQRDRCDWPDAFNLLFARAAALQWNRLIERISDDASLFAAVLEAFLWLSPARAGEVPAWVREKLRIRTGAPHGPVESTKQRADRLDSRPWFRGAMPATQQPRHS